MSFKKMVSFQRKFNRDTYKVSPYIKYRRLIFSKKHFIRQLRVFWYNLLTEKFYRPNPMTLLSQGAVDWATVFEDDDWCHFDKIRYTRYCWDHAGKRYRKCTARIGITFLLYDFKIKRAFKSRDDDYYLRKLNTEHYARFSTRKLINFQYESGSYRRQLAAIYYFTFGIRGKIKKRKVKSDVDFFIKALYGPVTPFVFRKNQASRLDTIFQWLTVKPRFHLKIFYLRNFSKINWKEY